jgi:hypothetical protein
MKIRNFFFIISILSLFTPPVQPAPISRPAASPTISAAKEAWRTYTNDASVQALAIQGDYLWAGTNGGVVRWNTTDGSYTKYTNVDGLPNNDIHAIASDANGNIWVGTYGYGVSKFNGSSWTTYTTANGLADNRVNVITSDAAGNLWVGTDCGVNELILIRSLISNYANGGPGSYFNLASDHFLLNQSVPVSVNGSQLGNVPISTNGTFTFTLSTANASDGLYIVKVGTRPSVQARLRLDAQQPMHPKEGDFTTYNIPSGIAFTNEYYLPAVLR